MFNFQIIELNIENVCKLTVLSYMINFQQNFIRYPIETNRNFQISLYNKSRKANQLERLVPVPVSSVPYETSF